MVRALYYWLRGQITSSTSAAAVAFTLAVLLTGLLALSPDLAFAGTGGSEVASWYTDISNALKGFWGKLIAMAFIGFSLVAFKEGAIIPAIFLIFVGLGVGVIPDIVDARFTLTF
jgi:conjugal transfer pilus assembly protein TraA